MAACHHLSRRRRRADDDSSCVVVLCAYIIVEKQQLIRSSSKRGQTQAIIFFLVIFMYIRTKEIVPNSRFHDRSIQADFVECFGLGARKHSMVVEGFTRSNSTN